METIKEAWHYCVNCEDVLPTEQAEPNENMHSFLSCKVCHCPVWMPGEEPGCIDVRGTLQVASTVEEEMLTVYCPNCYGVELRSHLDLFGTFPPGGEGRCHDCMEHFWEIPAGLLLVTEEEEWLS